MKPCQMLTLPCSSKQLNLEVCLLNGQSFRWRKRTDGLSKLVGVAKQRVWEIRRKSEHEIEYRVLANFQDSTGAKRKRKRVDDGELLREYFQLVVDTESLYAQWKEKDSYFAKKVNAHPEFFEGIRILAQDPLETILAFICSANNNITRISRMVEKLCQLYGTRIELHPENGESEEFFNFPSLSQLNQHLPAMEQQLRTEGFGYRAGYIAGAVKKLAELGAGGSWFNTLRDASYSKAKEQLLQLPGVGPKVADCICLMALQKHEVVPVDTHVFQLTAEVYMPQYAQKDGAEKKNKTVSKKMHAEIGRFYVDHFGPFAGWAQSVLFSTRLKQYSTIEEGN